MSGWKDETEENPRLIKGVDISGEVCTGGVAGMEPKRAGKRS